MLNPLMLLGLLGLSVPIIIHLIQKQRLKPQLLATLQFLDREDVANVFAPVPRDLLQLILRLLLLGLFALLMSRLAVGTGQTGPRTMAVILDQSMSMQQKASSGKSLFEHHREQILELIAGMGPDDKMSLILVGDKVTLETGYLQDKDELLRVARGFEASASGALALVPAIRSATNQLRSRREVNACVIVFSDHQEANYLSAIEESRVAEADNPTKAFRDAIGSSHVRLCLVDEAAPSPENLAVEQARFTPESVTVGSSSRLTAVVRNFTEAERTTTVQFREGDKAGEQRSLTLMPGEAACIDLVNRFEASVDSACRVEIEEDALPGDNTCHVPMRMKDRKQILLVAPHEERDEEAELELSYRGVDLLGYALNPGEALGLGTGTAVNVKRITPRLLERVSLPIYSVVILYGIETLPEQSGKDLLAFIRNGGGLCVIPSREMSPLRFNEAFGALLRGFTVGQLKQPDEVQPLDRNESRLPHPMLFPLLRGEWGDPADIHFAQYFAVETSGEAEAVLRAANGDWLAVVVRQDRGQVYLQLFSCELEDSSLPRTVAFVPMVQEIMAALSRQHEEEPPAVMRVGEVLRMQLPEFRGLSGNVSVSGAETRQFPLTGPDGEEIRVDGLLKAGAYEVLHPSKASGRKRWLAVNPVQGESNLAKLSDEEQETLFGKRNTARLAYAGLAGQFTQRQEVVKLMIVLVVVAFAVEAAMGAWQSRVGARSEETGATAG